MSDEPPKTFTQDEVNRIAAAARDEGRKSAEKKPGGDSPPAAAPMDAQSIAAIVAATVNAMKQPEATQVPRPAAAPSAPSGSSLPDSRNYGLVDVFSMSREQANQLGPRGVRKALEAAWDRAADLDGRPARPKAPGSK